jgi:hypothetical protein
MAAAPVCGWPSLFSRDPRHALARLACLRRADRAGHRLPGGGPGHPGHGAGVRGRCAYGAAVAGRRGGAAAGLLAARPARRAGPAGATGRTLRPPQRGPGRRGQRGRGHRASRACASVGLGRDGPGEQTAAGPRRRGAHARDGAARDPPRGAGLSPRPVPRCFSSMDLARP